MFCVCRGKVSEGLDFSDELCRAVIFVGIPFPNTKDPILNEKKMYYDKLSKTKVKSITGDDWYTLNTMRSVNQGLGRVIRHINDYGMIFLLDERYEQQRLKKLLPGWSLTNMEIYDDFQNLTTKMGVFFREMKIKFPQQ